MTPSIIADAALIQTSAWQSETSQQTANRLLYRDQARRWEANDNISNDQYGATLDAVCEIMGQRNG